MKEKDFQRWVIGCAKALGWKVWHVPAPMQWDSTGSGKGFVGARGAAGLSDLVLVRERVIFAEVKGTSGKLSEKQKEFIRAVNETGSADVVAYEWWPGDENDIEKLLARPKAA
jgi:glycosidase